LTKQEVYAEFVKEIDALVEKTGMNIARSKKYQGRPNAIDEVRQREKFKMLNWSYDHALNIYYRLYRGQNKIDKSEKTI